MEKASATAEVISKRSEAWCRLIQRVFTTQLKKSFHAIHLLNRPPIPDESVQIICYMNHPSWNDPMVGTLLHYHFFPNRQAYAPIDADAIKGYPFMRKIGLYGVTQNSTSGTRQFLRTSKAILTQSTPSIIWITAQGRFADIRERPVVLQPGLGALLNSTIKTNKVIAIPLAVEYAFGEEKRPEVFINFGSIVEPHTELSVSSWTRQCEASLELAQDELAKVVMTRNHEKLTTLLGGSTGVGGVYGQWQRVKALVTGQKFDPSHKSLTDTDS